MNPAAGAAATRRTTSTLRRVILTAAVSGAAVAAGLAGTPTANAAMTTVPVTPARTSRLVAVSRQPTDWGAAPVPERSSVPGWHTSSGGPW